MKEAIKWFAPLLIAVVLVSAVLLFIGSTRQAGYDEGFIAGKAERAEAYQKLKDEIQGERLEHANDALAKAQAAAKSLLEQTKRGDDLASQLTTTKEELRRNTDKLTGEINRVTTLYRRAVDAQPEPLPTAVFTTGFVRLWNESLNPTAVRARQPASGSAATSRSPRAADDLDSGITPAVLLNNQVRNSEKHASCRAQLTSLIEYYTHGR